MPDEIWRARDTSFELLSLDRRLPRAKLLDDDAVSDHNPFHSPSRTLDISNSYFNLLLEADTPPVDSPLTRELELQVQEHEVWYNRHIKKAQHVRMLRDEDIEQRVHFQRFRRAAEWTARLNVPSNSVSIHGPTRLSSLRLMTFSHAYAKIQPHGTHASPSSREHPLRPRWSEFFAWTSSTMPCRHSFWINRA